MEELKSKKLFGVKITTESEDKILEYITACLKNGGKKLFITTPNPEIIMYARAHPEYKKLINEASIALPDGVGVSIASLLCLGHKVPRITGADMVEKLCSRLSKSPYSIGFFGAQPGIAELASKCLLKKYSGMNIVYASDTWDEHKMKGKKIDVLFVAMGHPKQEEWISQNLDVIPVSAAMGVGGTFDYIAGIVPRAPKFLRTIGLEWFYRLVKQPWRIKRQLALVTFSLLTFKEMFTSRFPKSS